MAGGKLHNYSGSNMTVLLQNEMLPCSSEVLDSLWFHSSHPSFQGSKSLVKFENVSSSRVTEENCDDEELLEGCFYNQPGNSKKRRLTSQQVQLLERNFELENKLEPEKKVQLAKEVGLQPRQVAIWYQNRRARFKTKQLEKDYATLKASYDQLKGDYDKLLQENQKLKEEVNSVKNRLIPREKENLDDEDDDKSSDAVNSKEKEPVDIIPNGASENGSSTKVPLPTMVICKQEDVNSAKSDVLDSDSLHYTDGNHSPVVEPAYSSHDHSDFSQDEEDNLLSQNLLTLPCLPKVELEDGCYDDPSEKSCNFGFTVEDQTFCFWPY